MSNRFITKTNAEGLCVYLGLVEIICGICFVYGKHEYKCRLISKYKCHHSSFIVRKNYMSLKNHKCWRQLNYQYWKGYAKDCDTV